MDFESYGGVKNVKIDNLIFPKGCQTIPSALKRSGFEYLEDLEEALKDQDFRWRGVGQIRMKLIKNWLINRQGKEV